MSHIDQAETILREILEGLGFEIDVQIEKNNDEYCLQIESPQSRYLIGAKGDRLEDIQYLINRILLQQNPDAPRIKIDCQQHRHNLEKALLKKVSQLAERVKSEKKSAQTRPLNAYYRRIVHNAFVDDAEIQTSSAQGTQRYKRITLSLIK